MGWREDLLNDVDIYCALTGRARSGVGVAIMNDHKLFDEIEAGRNCTADNLDKIKTWLAENTPVKPNDAARKEKRT